MKNFVKFALCGMLVIAAALPSYAAPFKMKISMGDPDTHINLKLMKEEFKPSLEKATKGQVVVEVYAGGILGSYRESIEGMQMGSIEAAQVNASSLTGFSKRYYCVGLPYAFPDKKSFYKAYNGAVGKKLFEVLPPVGLIGVGYLDNGMRSVTNNRKPIHTPDDLKGLKIRVLESPINIATWKLLGANPTPISYGELYTALQQKTVDAQENCAVIINEIKLQQVQKYYSLTKHQSDVDVLLISKKFYDKLSPELQKIVINELHKYCALQQKAFEKEDAKAMDKLKKDGMVVNDLSDTERKAFFDKVRPIYKQFRNEIGGDLVDLIMSYQNK